MLFTLSHQDQHQQGHRMARIQDSNAHPAMLGPRMCVVSAYWLPSFRARHPKGAIARDKGGDVSAIAPLWRIWPLSSQVRDAYKMLGLRTQSAGRFLFSGAGFGSYEFL